MTVVTVLAYHADADDLEWPFLVWIAVSIFFTWIIDRGWFVLMPLLAIVIAAPLGYPESEFEPLPTVYATTVAALAAFGGSLLVVFLKSSRFRQVASASREGDCNTQSSRTLSMDKVEAKEVLDREVDRLRRQTYEQLSARIPRVRRRRFLFLERVDEPQVETHEVRGGSGTIFQVMTEVRWDGRPRGDLRVLASVDDGGLSAFVPLTDSFILGPDGTFVGE